MGRSPCCSKVGLRRGAWSSKEDKLLSEYIQTHGEGHWRSLPKKAGLLRCGKSCRLRWLNYLRPDIKRGNITPEEDDIIIRLHRLLGNRWSLIAGRLPGRTDNEIKNYWNTHLSKRLEKQGTYAMKWSGDSKNMAKMEPRVHVPRPLRLRVTNQKFESEEDSTKNKTASLTSDRIAEAMAFIENICENDLEDDDVNALELEIGSNVAASIDGSFQTLYEEYTQLLKPSTSLNPRQEDKEEAHDEDEAELDVFAQSLLV